MTLERRGQSVAFTTCLFLCLWSPAVDAADEVIQKFKTIASAVPELPVAGKIAAFASLKDRSDPAVREAALKSLQQADTEVRTIALVALIASGVAGDASTLADLASTADDLRVRDAAFETLRLMTAVGTNKAMLALMNEAKTPNPVLVKCALARRSPEFVPAFLEAAESSGAATRLEAFKALEIMATASEAEALAGLLGKTAPGEERAAAGRAVWMSCQKILDPGLRPAPLLAALAKADVAGQCAILPSLARLGGERSLTAVHAAMQSRTIVSRLGSVRGPDALTLLLSLVEDEKLRHAAVPAVFTLAKGLSQSHPEQAKAALEKIRPLTEDAAILQQIPKVLRDIEMRRQGQKE